MPHILWSLYARPASVCWNALLNALVLFCQPVSLCVFTCVTNRSPTTELAVLSYLSCIKKASFVSAEHISFSVLSLQESRLHRTLRSFLCTHAHKSTPWYVPPPSSHCVSSTKCILLRCTHSHIPHHSWWRSRPDTWTKIVQTQLLGPPVPHNLLKYHFRETFYEFSFPKSSTAISSSSKHSCYHIITSFYMFLLRKRRKVP